MRHRQVAQAVAQQDHASSAKTVNNAVIAKSRPLRPLGIRVLSNAAYEAFMTTKLSGLPEVLRLTSHLTMKEIKHEA
jgi:hypothetical protein